MSKKTLFDKIWDKHVVSSIPDGPDVFYIDIHYIHEVTSPQAFEGLRKRGIKVLRPNQVVATADHNVPTENQHLPIQNELSRLQVSKLVSNCAEFGIELYGLGHANQGIVHVIGPELGVTKPGMTMVCGDSHTSTHGAFGCIAFGIGTSEVEQVLATQCLLQNKPKKMLINVNGNLQKGVTAKDIVLYIIAQISAGGGTGYFIEFAGSAFRQLSMEGRMTVCNMSIEMGARGGLIAPDEVTFEYVKGRPHAPKGEAWDKALAEWKELYTDEGAEFDKVYNYDAADIEPMITYGTNPGMGIGISKNIPSAQESGAVTEKEVESFEKALNYMGFQAGEKLEGKPVNYVFVGSCTNARIEDFREVAKIVQGKQKAPHVNAWLVPGSKQVEKQIYDEGLAAIIEAAGFKIRQPGCSACLAMNDDKVPAGEYCVSTSNRNFEGRQGQGARTLLASPATAAATAIAGVITNPKQFLV
ncbi:MAG: hypothetical protein RLZZ414_542 [Bacteroidota bacterium]|jgi:3-isopropylmalate/(R)-2-methylmalate dehydratase large subunit